MKGKDIENLVIVKLEEYSPYNPSTDGPLVVGGDVLDEIKPIYSYVSQHLAEAANEMLLIAPIHKLYPKEYLAFGIEDEDDSTIGHIVLPADYLRIHTLQMDDWRKPIHITFKNGDAVDNQQNYKWTRGTFIKPVAVENGERYRVTGGVYQTSEHNIDEALESLRQLFLDKYGVPSETDVTVGLANGEYYRCVVKFEECKELLQTSYIKYDDKEYNYYEEQFVGRTECLKWVNHDAEIPIVFTIKSDGIVDGTQMYTIQDGELKEIDVSGRVMEFDLKYKMEEFSYTTDKIDSEILRYYSTKGDHTVKTFLYIPCFSEEQEYNDSVAELIALNCAKKVCEVFERADSLQIINAEMQNVLQNLGL